MKHCLKQVVKASIYNYNHELLLVAYNYIENDSVTECPRKDMKTGEGYELCASICNQKGHAEIQAVNKANQLGIDLLDCYLVLEGHTYICDTCIDYMELYGLLEWRIA